MPRGSKPEAASKVVTKARPPNAGKGRVKGVPNKTTAALKDAILNALTTVGGEAYLVKVAKKDVKTFCALLGKVLPMQVTGEGGGALTLQIITGVPRAGD